jgi:alkylation response protein AidB-like acyl-CoA dehydrogenase
MKSPYFSKEHDSFRKHLREFFSEEVMPFVNDWESERSIPKDVWQKLGQQGLLGINHPKIYGGTEMDFFSSIVFLEELGRTGYGGFGVAVAVQAYMATSFIAHAGSDELKRKYLSSTISGEKVVALGITEPNSGSDLNQLQTHAVLDGDSFIVNGKKKFIANGTTADFIVLAVRTAPAKEDGYRRGGTGISLLIVETGLEGVNSKKLDNIGWHCSDTAELYFDNVCVPSKNLIGTLNYGFYYIMRCLQLERLAAGTLALGSVDYCMEMTRQYVTQRKVFNSPLASFQALRHRIADLATEVESLRQLVHYTAWLYQQGELPIAECSMTKLKATELVNRVVNECLQWHGAYGYLAESAIARMYRDTRACTIAGGASEVIRDIIAQTILNEVR